MTLRIELIREGFKRWNFRGQRWEKGLSREELGMSLESASHISGGSDWDCFAKKFIRMAKINKAWKTNCLVSSFYQPNNNNQFIKYKSLNNISVLVYAISVYNSFKDVIYF